MRRGQVGADDCTVGGRVGAEARLGALYAYQARFPAQIKLIPSHVRVMHGRCDIRAGRAQCRGLAKGADRALPIGARLAVWLVSLWVARGGRRA